MLTELQSDQNAPAVPTGLPNGTATLENSLLDIPLPEDPTAPSWVCALEEWRLMFTHRFRAGLFIGLPKLEANWMSFIAEGGTTWHPIPWSSTRPSEGMSHRHKPGVTSETVLSKRSQAQEVVWGIIPFLGRSWTDKAMVSAPQWLPGFRGDSRGQP